MTRSTLTAILAATTIGGAMADSFTIDADFDRWNYPFNGTNGIRSTASTFAAFTGPSAFDERDGQFLLGFDVSSFLPALPSGQSYQINSVVVTATHFSGSFVYDPTYDGFATYIAAPDLDAGRPITLTGTGFRAPYTGGTTGVDFAGPLAPPLYSEGEVFGFGDPSSPEVRSAFAASFVNGVLTDVSNNVFGPDATGGFDFTPFAVGTTDLTPGDDVVEGVPGVSPGSTFEFDVNLADADILDYILQGIDEGELFFSISSLHQTTQAGGTNPNFYTTDNFDPGAISPTLTVDFTVIPEPASLALLAVGGVCLLRRVPRRG